MTAIINLFGGPGVGKSTVAPGLFSLMKKNGISCELVHETAKFLTWEERKIALACQPYIFGKQLLQIERLVGKVDFIVTDSPLLLSSHYSSKYYPDSWVGAVIDICNRFDNINFVIRREVPYVEAGRNQNEEEAIRIDDDIVSMLRQNGLYWKTISEMLYPGLDRAEIAYWHLQAMAEERGIKIPTLFA